MRRIVPLLSLVLIVFSTSLSWSGELGLRSELSQTVFDPVLRNVALDLLDQIESPEKAHHQLLIKLKLSRLVCEAKYVRQTYQNEGWSEMEPSLNELVLLVREQMLEEVPLSITPSRLGRRNGDPIELAELHLADLRAPK